ncbi:2-succinyl-5-enolpyruvyl-6-hydroxy-3-cyclohexene-1-carboxylic-acid synthase [Halalkalibacillus sediminis]|uniref:2-succinyl-5-enolpyruvyl-6-hydroxy-3-cyclohexene-1-carboxylate synthase n=2 Tax=Halalkalibacillus sediminis TaxID=2018042 RepID=A0A2I0QV10_9BACI|nr:2-succinyl-5-enolpyruvyl-6-hydroxy-3-cyclohexene-1-carboxylic-acid synthase [Halalkalibacillus sediminis]
MGKSTYYVSNFIDELFVNGVEDIVISPGSRSTPLAMTVAEHPHLKEWIHFDERSAAFFALGIAKTKRKPVVLVCTSGTAVANYFPAVVEAYYSRVPLILLTSDRPHELRDNGAPQSIDQIKIFGDYTKFFHEMALPDGASNMIDYARRQASRACYLASQSNPGVVQFNFPFRDPLIPDLSLENLWGERSTPYLGNVNGRETVSFDEMELLVDQLKGDKKGLVVCGELTDEEDATAILELADELNVPVLADVLSNLRQHESTNDNIISTYDAVLKDEEIASQLNADFIIRFGAMPVSKAYFKWLQSQSNIKHYVVEQSSGYREPTNVPTMMIYSDVETFATQLIGYKHEISINEQWTQTWMQLDKQSRLILENTEEESELTEGHVALALSRSLPSNHSVFVGNSMPIRDMDTFFLTEKKQVKVFANRGANGIDGVISSALGAAVAGEKVTLLIGDLSFLHDYTSLFIARKYKLNIRVIVNNNDGGGIFSFLPQHEEKEHFEPLFGTPFDPQLKLLVEAVQGNYRKVDSMEELEKLISEDVTGTEIIEVQTDREANLEWHRSKWQNVKGSVEKHLKGSSS